jgi:hypothetical protein
MPGWFSICIEAGRMRDNQARPTVIFVNINFLNLVFHVMQKKETFLSMKPQNPSRTY